MKKGVIIGLLLVLSCTFVFADPAGDFLIQAARSENPDTLRQALNSRVPVNYVGSDGLTALMIACEKEWVPGVNMLLEAGANASFENIYGRTALMIAVKYNRNDNIARLLINRGANINKTDTSGNTVLMYAVQNRSSDMIDFVLRSFSNTLATNVDGEDALIIAAKENNIDAVRRLLQRSANLYQTALNGYTAFLYACDHQNMEMIPAFVEKGIDVTRQNSSNGMPPLLWLIQFKKSTNVIQYLLINTDAIHSRDRNGRDAFQYAQNYDRSNDRLRRMLEENRDR